MSKLPLDKKLKTGKEYEAMFGEQAPDTPVFLEIDKLLAYPKSKFITREERIQELQESIERSGLFNPIIVVPAKENKTYYILSGMHRTAAYKRLGHTQIEAYVKQDISEESADIILVDSNLDQNRPLSLSEKAFAYRTRNDALKKRQKSQIETSETSAAILSREAQESRATIFRFIALSDLIEPLLEKLDQKQLPVGVGVAISALSPKSQMAVDTFFFGEDIRKPSVKFIGKLRDQEEQYGELCVEKISELFALDSPKMKAEDLKIKGEKLNGILDGIPVSEREGFVLKAIQYYLERER